MHWRVPHFSAKTLRTLAAWTIVIVVLVVAVMELAWMGQRVREHRAIRANEHSPPKVFSLPLTGFKP
ncbi:MAG: hypothetical protein M3Z31_12970 [Pseudomonadota bacterium]|nr:hypothetical protein [Pseudomonadota bacterium]